MTAVTGPSCSTRPADCATGGRRSSASPSSTTSGSSSTGSPFRRSAARTSPCGLL